MVHIMLAEGFEEIEALAPADILRRGGLDVSLTGVTGAKVTGSHGITVTCDRTVEGLDARDIELLILPGGMPGAENLYKSDPLRSLIRSVVSNEGYIAAICAAPLVLGRMGLLRGKNAICYPGIEKHLEGSNIIEDAYVVTDGRFITAKGAGVAAHFAFTLLTLLKDMETAKAVHAAMQYPKDDGFFA